MSGPASGDDDARRREWAEDSATEANAPLDASARAAAAEQVGQTFLVVRVGEQASLLDLTDPGEWVIGRSTESRIPVDDQQVSRAHAKLTLVSGVLAVEDLGSRNGTLVNGRAVHKATVRIGTGDVIEVGKCQLVVATRTARPAGSLVRDEIDLADFVLADPEMVRVYESARKVAPMPTTVLILGETGSGKDVLAQRIHMWSSRVHKPFVRINCAGIPESLLESELFGHERGAFTGADRRKAGYFEAANEGSIFLDEIGELSESAQLRLLHVLENRTVTRLGGTSALPVDVRVVCATHRDLQTLVSEECFRADLYYRISPFVIRVPPLRQRRAEIQPLANTFLRQLAGRIGRPTPLIAPDALDLLMRYGWPGNTRELRNAVEHAFVMADGATLRREHFARELEGMPPSVRPSRSSRSMQKQLAEAERSAIEAALAAEGGNQTRAAARLGMPRRTFVYKLTQYRRQLERQAEDEGTGGEGEPGT